MVPESIITVSYTHLDVYKRQGTLGGAVVMNAGAYGGEMKDVLASVRVMTEEGEIMELPAEELGLGYRTSIIPEKRYIVLGAVISLTEGKKEEIKAQMDDRCV